MTAWLVTLLWKPVAAILAVLGIWFAGNRHARQRAENDALRGHINTRERIDNAPHTSDPDTARDRLRRRDPRKP